MQGNSSFREGGARRQGDVYGEGVLHDGIDVQSARRAHMRELTTARQAAERRRTRPLDGDYPTRQAAAQERAAELQSELARIEAAHQQWLRDHGEAES